MASKPTESFTAETLDFPEWKHQVLKFVARLLFLFHVKYVILIHDIKETKDEDGRGTRPHIPEPRVQADAPRRANKRGK